MDRLRFSRRAERRALGRLCFLLALGTVFSGLISATSIIPISDRELLSRADVVVRGVVVSTEVSEDPQGRAQTVTTISPLEVLKGEISGPLVLRELGGELSDGRFFKIWGRPEYQPGHEVVVFALARPGGDYQTAELLLGKFEVQKDELDQLFAVPALTADAPAGVTVTRIDQPGSVSPLVDSAAPRELQAFLRMVRQPTVPASASPAAPSGKLQPVLHLEYVSRTIRPSWVNQGGLWRWNNGATAVFSLDGIANVTGGGVAEATGAAATWSTEPHSNIAYSIGSSTVNLIHMDAQSSPCGWTSCLAGAGVIGCGGYQGGGSNVWRGETYINITSGEVWLRSYCSMNLYPSVATQSVLTHELGHTLGLGHSDSGLSPHDVCIGDENLATMRSVVQSDRTTLGTDDSDAVRWLYGDGGNSCNVGANPPTVTTGTASAGQATATLNGTVNPNGKSATGYFEYGTTSGYGTTTGSQAVGTGTTAVAVSAALTGLPCGVLIHFRAAGTNADGTGDGADQTFTTGTCAPTPPTVTTNAATGVAQSAATLKGTVNPNGTATSVSFEYGTTTGYGSTSPSQAIGSGTGSVAVSQAVWGLNCGTAYHFRAVATTLYTTMKGLDQTLTTTACTPTSFYTVTPCRIADTRNADGPSGGPALAGGDVRSFPATGVCGIPSTAKAIAVNLAVYLPSAAGDLRAYPSGGSVPMASSLNFRAGVIRSNSTLIPVGSGGQVTIQCDMASGGTNVFFDVFGYFQ